MLSGLQDPNPNVCSLPLLVLPGVAALAVAAEKCSCRQPRLPVCGRPPGTLRVNSCCPRSTTPHALVFKTFVSCTGGSMPPEIIRSMSTTSKTSEFMLREIIASLPTRPSTSRCVRTTCMLGRTLSCVAISFCTSESNLGSHFRRTRANPTSISLLHEVHRAGSPIPICKRYCS